MRAKRHVHHTVTEKESPNNSNEFVKRIFREFGNGETLTMNVTGFEKMLKKLGLLNIFDQQQQQTQNTVSCIIFLGKVFI